MVSDNGAPRAPRPVSIGQEIRAARKAAGISLRKLGEMAGVSHTTIGRFENGETTPRIDHLAAILAVLGVPQTRRDEIVELARHPDEPQWVAVGALEQDRQLKTLLDFEQSATSITDVSPLLVPGLMQTARYARAIMRDAGVPPEDVETRVAVRVGRTNAITRPNPVHLTAVVGEWVLQQRIGDSSVMHEQLQWFQQLAERTNVSVHVMPMNCEWSTALEGPFVLVESEDRPSVVHLENRVSGMFLHQPSDVSAYRGAIARVLDAAMTPAESLGVIADAIADAYEKETAQ